MEKFFEIYSNYLNNQFPYSIVQKILNGFDKKRFTTFRINTLKSNDEEVIEKLKKEKVDFKKASYFPNGFYFLKINENKALKLELIKEGKIYLQSFSSMIPAILIKPQKDEKILDITAAPGSKTSLLCALSANNAIIYANDKDKIRFERLKYNINLLGCKANLLNEKAEQIYKIFDKFFDKVLVDVPCSQEGLFLKNEARTYANWSMKEVESYSKLQQKILDSALQTLKDNGLCVYSTCTMNKKENEEVLKIVLEKYKIEPIDNLKIFDNIKDIQKSNLNINDVKLPIYRILPSEFFEGFTISIFKKST